MFRAAALLIVLVLTASPAAATFCPDLCDETGQSQPARCRHGAMPDAIGTTDSGTCDLEIGAAAFVPESAKRTPARSASAPIEAAAQESLSGAGSAFTHAARLTSCQSTVRPHLSVVLRV